MAAIEILDSNSTEKQVRVLDMGDGTFAIVHAIVDSAGNAVNNSNKFPVRASDLEALVDALPSLGDERPARKGVERFTSLTTPPTLTVPGTATWARVFCESGSVRVRDDGVAATTTGGEPVSEGYYTEVYDPNNASIIEETASSVITVVYY